MSKIAQTHKEAMKKQMSPHCLKSSKNQNIYVKMKQRLSKNITLNSYGIITTHQ